MNHLNKTTILLLAMTAIISTFCGEKQANLSAHDLVNSLCSITNSNGKTIEDVSKSALGVSIYQAETILQFEEILEGLPEKTKEQWYQAIEDNLINDPEYMRKIKPYLNIFHEAEQGKKTSRFNVEALNQAFQESKCFSLYQLLPMIITMAEEK